MPVAARVRGAREEALPVTRLFDDDDKGAAPRALAARAGLRRCAGFARAHARRLAAALALLLLLLARYLRAWAFEGVVRFATNGRLDELQFYAPRTLDCPPLPDAQPGAYVTVLGTVDYLPGVRVLAHALRQHDAQYPLVVLLPADFPAGAEQPLLADAAAHGNGSSGAFAVLPQRVRRLLYAPGWTTAGCRYWWLNAAGHYAELEQSLNKLWAFSLTRYAAVLYLDADVLPLAAPDELFALAGAGARTLRVGAASGGGGGSDAAGHVHAGARAARLPLFAAAPDWGRHGGDAPGFNAGVFLATPCEGLTEELRALAASPAHAHAARCHRRGTADQPLLQYYFGLDAFGLPLRYNALQPGLRARPRLGDAYPPVLLHFTKHKPWEAIGDAAASREPGMAEWAAVCAQLRCCDPPGACGPRKDTRPRGPHFRREPPRQEAS